MMSGRCLHSKRSVRCMPPDAKIAKERPIAIYRRENMVTFNDLRGTQKKINIHIESINDLTMDDYDFTIKVYTRPPECIIVTKDEMMRIDPENYVALIDTSTLHSGELKVEITVNIPDADFPDGYRKEISKIITNHMVWS